MTAQLATRLVSPPTQRRAADAHVAAIDRLAARIAADANTLGDPVTMARAIAIRQHCASYWVADAAEDGPILKALATVHRIVAICRALNVRLTAWLAKHGGRRG